MSAPYLITGADTYGDVYPRRDIVDLQVDEPKQFTLFILSWDEIRKPGYQPLAAQFAQIAGIHGMPYVRWPGDPDQTPQSVRGEWLGYCNHGSIMFPNWHRPYILLIEQAISEVAHGIAGKFANQAPSEAKQWMQAARELRFPFWDWTDSRTNTHGLPNVLTDPTLVLDMPGGGKRTHDNILAYYKFHQPVDGFNNRLEYRTIYDAKAEPQRPPDTMAYFKEWDHTYRSPNSSPVEVNDNIEQVNNILKGKDAPEDQPPFPVGSWANLSTLISYTFKFPTNIREYLRANAWDEFSNTRFQSGHRDPKNPKKVNGYTWNAAPIEQPHNYVHLAVGGIGHMGDNDTAGFDPIFYLHHCNVDRLLSFWEQVYPDYVAGKKGFLDKTDKERKPFTQKYGTYIETVQQEVDQDTPLMPFRKGDYTYWSSDDTHLLQHYPKNENLLRKYYTYPDIGEVKLNLGPPLSPDERKKQRTLLHEHFHVYSKYLPADFRQTEEHLLLISLSETYFTGSYMLKMSINIGGKDFEVGAVAVLGRGKSAGCGNCQGRRAEGARVHGVIPIPPGAVYSLVQRNIPMGQAPQTGAQGLSEAQSQAASKLLLESLRPHLVLPSGKYLSWPQEHAPQPRDGTILPAVLHNSALPEDAAPGIELLSRPIGDDPAEPHPVYLPGPGKDGELEDEDNWKNHGSPNFANWVEVA